MKDFPWLIPLCSQLIQLAARQQLPHALLLSGAKGTGKQALARQLARYLLCRQPAAEQACGQCKSCLLVKAGHHPDLWTPAADQHTGVDAIRQLTVFMQGAAQQGGKKVVILPDAEQMSEAAANALLKTLEEPPKDSFLLLLCAHPAQLLPTIRSRCQHWSLAPVFGADIQQWLAQHSSRPVPDFLLDYTGGAPLLALELLESDKAAAISAQLVLLEQYVEQKLDLYHVLQSLPDDEQLPMTLNWFLKQQLWTKAGGGQSKQLQLVAKLQQWQKDRALVSGQNSQLNLAALLLFIRTALV
ncbi:DNA polymerase III subunit delta' [Rheinheimera sp.]|uniref:DNA polymerase III subunit delta' n=1 Tax=Rheinheimera sp. TaxID=1869214 RepID=UPI00307F5773